MSLESLAMVLHHSRARGTDKLILIGIANHDGDGGAWPSLETLATYGGHVDERTVRRSLRRLEALGEVQTYVQSGGPSGIPAWKRTNRYEVLLSCPATCDRTKNHRNIPLPAAPADLWIKGGTPTPPGDAHAPRGGTPTPPDPGSPTPPKPSIEPSHEATNAVDESTTDRAHVCSVCSRHEHDCRSRVATSGHEFAARQLRSVR